MTEVTWTKLWTKQGFHQGGGLLYCARLMRLDASRPLEVEAVVLSHMTLPLRGSLMVSRSVWTFRLGLSATEGN